MMCDPVTQIIDVAELVKYICVVIIKGGGTANFFPEKFVIKFDQLQKIVAVT